MSHGRRINVIEAFAMSLASMAPTGAMAGNTAPGVKFAGINLPIAFLVAAVAMLFVAIGFCEMSKYISADGSVYAYNRVALGEHWGFTSGWIMLLAYTFGGAAMSTLAGTNLDLIFKNLGLNIPPLYVGVLVILLMWFILSHGIKLTSNISLFTESLALLFLLILSYMIFAKGGGHGGINSQPFIPQVSISGIGQGVVYTVLCFVGFEIACSVATRTKNPKHTIPLALLLTIIGGMVIFVFVSYAMVIGFGTKDASVFAASQSPLNVLTNRFIGRGMATVVDFAIFLSAFGADVCITNGAIYMFYAFGKKEYIPKRFGTFNDRRDAPSFATHVVCAIILILYLILDTYQGNANTYLYYISVTAIGMIIIYMFACVGSFVYFRKHQRAHHSFFKHDLAPLIGFVVLAFPLVSNFYPVPKAPLCFLPYLILAWGAIGYWMSVHHTKKLNG